MLTSFPAWVLWSLQQPPQSIGNQVDLNTVLLTIVLAISGWTLNTVLRHMRELTQISQQLWGKDGKNGHASEIRQMRKGLQGIERAFRRLVRRVDRLEERSGIHEALRDDDDAEDDRRGDAEE
jgi:uncharacterized protein YukE